MVRSNVRDDANRRVRYFAQPGRLTDIVHPHLNDGPLMVWLEAEYRLGNPQPIIEVALCLEDPPAMCHDIRDHFLGRRLPITARHGDDWNFEATSKIRGQLLIGIQRISDSKNHRAHSFGATLPHTSRNVVRIKHDRSNCTSSQRRFDKIMSVESFPSYGDKKISGTKGPRVEVDATDTRFDPGRLISA